MNEPWLPYNYQIFEGATMPSLVTSADDWQIFRSKEGLFILAISSKLYNNLGIAGFIDSNSFERISVSGKEMWVYVSEKHKLISSIQSGPFEYSYSSCLNFAQAMKNTHKIDSSISLYDAIFVEELNRLLPTFTENVADDTFVLGTWLANGIRISTNSFRELTALVSHSLSFGQLTKIIESSGLKVNLDELFERHNSTTPKSDEKVEIITSKSIDGKFHIPGRPELEAFFNDYIIDIIKNIDEYKRMGIEFPSATILYGPPGCGKTYAVEKLAEFIGWKCYSINSSTIGSPYIHETSKRIAEIFDNAISHAPSILIIDEMEAYLSNRDTKSSGLYHTEEVAEFLRKIPTAIANKVLIFAMTNRIDDIDPAILRTGRFDHKIEISYPTPIEVEQLLNDLLKNLPVANDVDIPEISRLLAGHPFSDVSFIVREAGRLAVKDGRKLIDNHCFFSAIEKQFKKTGISVETSDNYSGYQ